MATKIKTLTDKNEDVILPRTVAKAVTLEDGSSLEYALVNRETDDVKITEQLASELNLPLGTPVTEIVRILYAGVKANSVVLEATVE